MKKRILALVLALCMICSMGITVFAEDAPTGTISLSASRSGSTITVTASLSNISEPVALLQFDLTYDTSKVTFDSATTFSGDMTVNDHGGSARCLYAPASGSLSGATTLCTVTFKVVSGATGDASFGMTGAKMADEDNNKFSVSTSGASVGVHDHNWGSWTETKAPTCVAEGEKTRTCTSCGESETEVVPATGKHEYGEYVVTKAATCGEKGVETATCKNCDATTTKEIAATGKHTWGEWKTEKAATCTETGTQKRTCSVCSKTETKEIAKADHKYVDTVVKPTCSEKGYTLHKCSVCGDEKKDTYVAATGKHDWSAWKTERAATCAAAGVETHTCSTCKTTEKRDIAKLDHKYTTRTVAPTCTSDGYTENKCSVCGNVTKSNTVKATGHKFGSWTVVKEPTCTEVGSQYATCSVCSYKSYADIEKKPHDYVDGICTICNKVDPSLDPENHNPHEFGEWTVVKEATCEEPGEQTRVCECTTTETEEIPALGHDYVDGVCSVCKAEDPNYVPETTPATEPTEPTVPGDDTQEPKTFNAMWIIIPVCIWALVAAIVIIVLLMKKKKAAEAAEAAEE